MHGATFTKLLATALLVHLYLVPCTLMCRAFSNVTINQDLHNQPIIKLHEWQITSSIKRLLALVFTQIMRFSERVKHPPAYKEDLLYIT